MDEESELIQWDDDPCDPGPIWNDLSDPGSIWDALHALIDAVHVLTSSVSNVAHHARRALRRPGPSVTGISAVTSIGELLSGVGASNLSVRVGITLILGSPAGVKLLSILDRESDRRRVKVVRATHESVADYPRQRQQARKVHAELGRRLSSQTDLATLRSTAVSLSHTVDVLQRRQYSPTVILVQERENDLKIVQSAGGPEPALEVGVQWPRSLIYNSDGDGYGRLMARLHLHHARVRLWTGTRAWDVICVAEGVLSDEAVLGLCDCVTEILESALEAQVSGKLSSKKWDYGHDI